METLINANEALNTGVFRSSPLNARFDVQLIANQIQPAELRFIKPLLCKDLYEDMIADIIDYSASPDFVSGTLYVATDIVNFYGFAYECIQNTTGAEQPLNTLFWTVLPKFANAFYQTLWDKYLFQLCGRSVYLQSLPNILIQTGANGLFINNSEFARGASKGEMQLLQDNETRTIDVFTAEIKEYLCDNRTDYPLYPADKLCKCHVSGCGCDTCKGTSPYKKNVLKWF